MVEHETCGMAIEHQLTTLTVSFDAAAHNASVSESFHEIEPEPINCSFAHLVVVFDHFVREHTAFFISDQDLFRLEASEFLNGLINISRNQISIASMQFCVCFFDQGYPKFSTMDVLSFQWAFGFSFQCCLASTKAW